MLDYTLVSTKATYRMPTPRDVPGLVRLAQAFARETRGVELPAERVMATVRELERDREKGSLFLFERDGGLAGYAILIRYWSNEAGSTVLAVDEIYVAPGERRQGLARDFIGLLCKVAPEGVASLQVEAGKGSPLRFWRGLGFTDTGRAVLSLPMRDPSLEIRPGLSHT